jgi:sugar phosphate isomerase/epimerase
MKLCAVSDSLGSLSFNEAAKASAVLGLEALEIGMGNWSLSLAALNCSGNQLHPVDGERQSKVVYETIRLAELLGVDTIVLMSGLPGGGPKDLTPNWVTCAWPPGNHQA